MEMTDCGIVMLVSPWHHPKAYAPIEVTELGIVMLVSPSHHPKAVSPIEVTELGMVMLVSPLHHLKASFPIDVTLNTVPSIFTSDGITILVEEVIWYFPLTSTVFLFLSVITNFNKGYSLADGTWTWGCACT